LTYDIVALDADAKLEIEDDWGLADLSAVQISGMVCLKGNEESALGSTRISGHARPSVVVELRSALPIVLAVVLRPRFLDLVLSLQAVNV
jgi:hypothetical protein